MLGMGLFNNPSSLSAVALATSTYRLPPAIAAVANATQSIVSCRERQSIEAEDAAGYGLRYDSLDDVPFFWGLHTFHHPLVVETSLRAQNRYRTYAGS